MRVPKFLLKLIIMNLIHRLILYGNFIHRWIQSGLHSYLIILYIRLHRIVLVLDLMLNRLILELDRGLDPLFGHLRLHLHLFVLLANYAELVRLVSHRDISRNTLITQRPLLLNPEASLPPAHRHALILHVPRILQRGVLLLVAILHGHINRMATRLLHRNVIPLIIRILLH